MTRQLAGLEGKQLLPREITAGLHEKWPGDELPKAVATSLGESQGFLGAWHDNLDEQGNVDSRDCGYMQINIAADKIGTATEDSLRTLSSVPSEYLPIVHNGAVSARTLYDTPLHRDNQSLPQTRRWQPWVAYTTGWATFPNWWIWSPKQLAWLPTGRYIQRALVGVANYHLVIAEDKTPAEAVAYAQTQATRFNVHGSLYIHKDIVMWESFPSRPAAPPADGIGPRPVPNDGI